MFSEPYIPTLFYEERKKTLILWLLLTITTSYTHTYIHTWQLEDQPGPKGQVSENEEDGRNFLYQLVD